MYLCNFSIKSMFHGKNYQVLKINNWNCYKCEGNVALYYIIFTKVNTITYIILFHQFAMLYFNWFKVTLLCNSQRRYIFPHWTLCMCLLLIQWMFTLHRLNTNPFVTFVILLAFLCIFSILLVAFSYGIHNVINFRWRISIFCKCLFDSLLNNAYGYQLTLSELNIKNFYLVLLNNVSLYNERIFQTFPDWRCLFQIFVLWYWCMNCPGWNICINCIVNFRTLFTSGLWNRIRLHIQCQITVCF